jgi:peptide/nickel transport system permease protein
LSVPVYWTATLAVVVLASAWSLPSSGTGGWRHLILPVLVLSVHVMGPIARVVQAGIREVQGAAFVAFAHSKGLHSRLVLRRHVLRVGLLPVFSVLVVQTGFLLGGTVITESVFVRAGLGRLLLTSVVEQDYPVVQGIMILSAIFYTLLNVIADALSRLADPRPYA